MRVLLNGLKLVRDASAMTSDAAMTWIQLSTTNVALEEKSAHPLWMPTSSSAMRAFAESRRIFQLQYTHCDADESSVSSSVDGEGEDGIDRCFDGAATPECL